MANFSIIKRLIVCALLAILATPTMAASTGQSSQPTRREFLRTAAILAPGFALNTGAAAGLDLVLKKNGDMGVLYVRTISEQHLLLIAEILISSYITAKTGAAFGNASGSEIQAKLEDSPGSMWTTAVILGPVLEAVMFRLIPGSISQSWTMGTISAVVFAGAHNLGQKGKEIPIGQFAAGLYYWYFMKERGISHSIIAHMANNNAAVIAMAIDQSLTKQIHLGSSCDMLLSN